MAVTIDDERGFGPDNMGDDEQETEVVEYERYIEDPPDNLEITEDNDNDAENAYDWAERHPEAAGHDGNPVDVRRDETAEESAVRVRRLPQ
jgi:hypothetical protein